MSELKTAGDIPPEVILTILEYLPHADIKRTRLVSKHWSELGAMALHVDTVYLSPRDKDMTVFDGITQHPVFKATVKHLVFDSAQFVRLSTRQYITTFIRSLEDQAAIEESPRPRELISLLNDPLSASDDKIRDTRHAHERFRSEEDLMDGFRQYSQLVHQQKNLLSRSWFERACQGLEALPHLAAVTVCNAWSMVHVEDFAGSGRQEQDYEQTDSDDADWEELFCEADHEGEGGGTVHSLLGDHGPALLWRDDDHSGLSPLARSWPATCLLPVGPMYPLSDSKRAIKTMGISDGCVEVLKLGQLLNATNKQPLEIVLPGGWGNQMGLSPVVFSEGLWPASTRLSTVCRKLEFLDVKLTYHVGEWDECPDFEGLKSMICNAPLLNTVWLSMPFYPDQGDVADGHFFSLSRIFPPVTEWQQFSLRELSLQGFSTSYSQLAGLLFLNLPNLKVLYLGYVLLMDGNWNDFVEGLSHLDTLQFCEIGQPLLYPPCKYYLDNNKEDWEEELSLLSQYIEKGGRHPGLLDHEPDAASSRYMVKLNETLEELQQGQL
ncbi:MAG: hypothetical protein Q9209_005924 [Squamulea sp. 1 TL-2023]